MLDLVLPDVSGWAVLKAIRASRLNRDTPVIVVTVVPDKNAGTVHAIQDYLIKPVTTEVLKGALEQAGIYPKENSGAVLVIDDDPQNLKLMRQHLEEAGYRAVLTRGGAEGLKAAASETPAAVILDLLMPEMDGF